MAYRLLDNERTGKKYSFLTLFDVGSKGFHRYENRLLDQTRGYAFALFPLHHLQKHLSVTYKALHCFPRTQNQSHHGFLPDVHRPLKSATISEREMNELN